MQMSASKGGEQQRTDVDLVLNCFERTYRKLLAPGYIRNIVEQNRFPFRHVTVLLNNIADPAAAEALVQELLRTGEITQWFSVADHLDTALQRTGLTRRRLGKLPFYSDWALVALTVPGSDWIVHWDADVQLQNPVDWITPSLELMFRKNSVATANPCWKNGDVSREERGRDGNFVISYGFTDQVFLLRRSEFARPIYHHWVPISMRYPVSHVGPYFEQWVDAYMRVNRRERATYIPACFTHATVEGSSYPTAWPMKAKNILRKVVVAGIRRLPLSHPYLSD